MILFYKMHLLWSHLNSFVLKSLSVKTQGQRVWRDRNHIKWTRVTATSCLPCLFRFLALPGCCRCTWKYGHLCWLSDFSANNQQSRGDLLCAHFFFLSLVKCLWLVSKCFKVHIWASGFYWFHGFNIVHVFTLPKLMSSYVHIYSIYSVLIVDSWVSVRCTSLNISTKCLIPTSCPTPQNLLCSTPSSLEYTNQHPSSFSVQRPSGHFILSSHIP